MIVDMAYSSICYTHSGLLDLYLTQVANMDTISTPYVSKDTNVGEKEVTVKREPYDDDCVM